MRRAVAQAIVGSAGEDGRGAGDRVDGPEPAAWCGGRELRPKDLDRLYDCLEYSLKAAIANGGVHTGEVIPHRRVDGHCPRCGGEMVHGTVGGRSTWWCGREQR